MIVLAYGKTEGMLMPEVTATFLTFPTQGAKIALF